MSGSSGSYPSENPRMRYLCEGYQLGIAIRNGLQDTNLVIVGYRRVTFG